MPNSNSNGNGKTSSSSNPSQKMSASDKSSMQSSQLMKLFEDELKDIYWAEKALTKAIPKMIEKSSSPVLTKALTAHLAETEKHVERVEQVFQSIGQTASAVKCEAIAGLMKEAESIMEECEEGSMRDAGIISAAQKIEHYEIASYGTLRQFAETLGLVEAEKLLKTILEEEKACDVTLTLAAVQAINVDASEEVAR
ncbi:MAG: ferritin-like domain-containing protein [Saprospiraceae bacterium]|nr:ferritin-like domain-containing protein [Saprospiraceae bacterium]